MKNETITQPHGKLQQKREHIKDILISMKLDVNFYPGFCKKINTTENDRYLIVAYSNEKNRNHAFDSIKDMCICLKYDRGYNWTMRIDLHSVQTNKKY